jgi:hypothetical protein
MRRPTRKHVVALVAVAIAALLIGFVVTLVSAARHAASRSQCQNNLKQLSLAAWNYSDVNRTFPPGTMPNPDAPPDRRMSWLMAILPFVESTGFRPAQPPAAWEDPKYAELVAFRMKPFVCPEIDATPGAVTGYTGVAGVGADAATLPVGHRRAGVFGYDRATKPNDVRDGVSVTLLIMESGRGPVPWARGGEGTVAWFDRPPHAGPGRTFGLPHRDGSVAWPWRPPPCGNVAFVNGSVRYFTAALAPEVFEALATCAGGEVPPLPE